MIGIIKPVLRKAFDFFVFSSFFIAFCAVLMVMQTCIVFGIDYPAHLLAFVFCGSVCSYNFHWFLTPPHTEHPSEKTLWNINYKYVHLALALLGLIAAAVFAWLLIEHWIWLMVTGFLTFLYTAPKIPHPLFIRLRKIAIGKTIFLAFAWTHITVLLPLIISGATIGPPEVVFTFNRFFFLYAICIIFDRRDVEEDRKAGIRTLVTWLDSRGVDVLFWSSLVVAFISSPFLLQWLSIPIVIALSFPIVLLSFLYYPSKKNNSDYLYYFILDGFMMLSAPFLILIKFAG